MFKSNINFSKFIASEIYFVNNYETLQDDMIKIITIIELENEEFYERINYWFIEITTPTKFLFLPPLTHILKSWQ